MLETTSINGCSVIALNGLVGKLFTIGVLLRLELLIKPPGRELAPVGKIHLKQVPFGI